MASVISTIFGGGVEGAGKGIAAVVNAIKGRNPEDAAKLQELLSKHQDLVITTALEQRKLDIAELQMQADVNKVEAANNSLFVAGWRPFIGWICGSALAFQFIVRPLLIWVMGMLNNAASVPELNTNDLFTLLFGMLGLGAMRSFDKSKGTSSGH